MSDNESTRDERLAEALRANLRKRKAQARETFPLRPPEPTPPEPTPPEPKP